MVNVVMTGGAGFLGSRLARELLAAGELALAGEAPRQLERVTLIDQVPVPPDLAADGRVTAVQGDLLELLMPRGAAREALRGADVLFHLAAAVSAECEADFMLGMRVNLGGTESLLASANALSGRAAARPTRALQPALSDRPVFVYASSLAVFGDSADHPLPAVIDDDTLPNPQTSYGTQKAVGELLLADYTRKGFLRGRAVRLATVAVRPGRPNAAASGFASSIIREPLAGRRVTCPVQPGTMVALASPGKAVAALLCAATASDQAWGGRSALTMPALTVTVADMAAALQRVAGAEVSALIDWVPDPAVQQIVASWPARVRADRAARLGLVPDPDLDSVIRAYAGDQATGKRSLASPGGFDAISAICPMCPEHTD
ncbi:MAG: NAD-dependent epimerase/dehydratase family protein [Streptosporangiaceae bacterium]|nr:NAD-dependent epimerase/dehydratase family protein [Streptosporangiaceae bacterium]